MLTLSRADAPKFIPKNIPNVSKLFTLIRKEQTKLRTIPLLTRSQFSSFLVVFIVIKTDERRNQKSGVRAHNINASSIRFTRNTFRNRWVNTH